MATTNPDGSGPGPMGDTLEFMKQLWGGASMPAMSMPSLSVEDINRKIADLKTVESWLTLNMNMLRATIQTLEVQSATLNALQSMGKSMGDSMGSMEQAMGAAMNAASSMASMNPMSAGQAAGGMSWPQAPAAASAGMSWPPASSPAPADPTPPGAAREPAADMAGPFSFSPPTDDKPPVPDSEVEAPPPQSAEAEKPSPDLGAAAPFVNPAAWWNMLQEQFKQAVTSAIAEDAPAAKARVARAAPKSTRSNGKAGASTSRPPRKTAARKKSGTSTAAASRPKTTAKTKAASAAKKSASRKRS